MTPSRKSSSLPKSLSRTYSARNAAGSFGTCRTTSTSRLASGTRRERRRVFELVSGAKSAIGLDLWTCITEPTSGAARSGRTISPFSAASAMSCFTATDDCREHLVIHASTGVWASIGRRICRVFPVHGAWRSLVSALVWGTRGPEFKSRRPDQKSPARAGLALSFVLIRAFLLLGPTRWASRGPPGRRRDAADSELRSKRMSADRKPS
jgi:hypothetical protein